MDTYVREIVVVKVTLPPAGGSHAVAKTEDGRTWSLPVNDRLMKQMGGNTACCFRGKVDSQGLLLQAKAPWQTWA